MPDACEADRPDPLPLRIARVRGPAIRAVIPALAELRVRVFAEWPYLYAGDPAYEAAYLAKYADTPGAVVVTAIDPASGAIAGAATALPLLAAEAELAIPFRAAGLDPADWYYFGESVLDRCWRGRGVGVAFFAEREAEARALGYAKTAFCGVQRPGDHPRRPEDHVPLDAFWRRRGYRPRPELVAHLEWQEIGQAAETAHQMLFWTREEIG